MTPKQIAERGEFLYESQIRSQVEQLVGRRLVIDIETGAFLLDSDDPLAASHELRRRNPTAILYALRIGQRACTHMSGMHRRLAS